MHCGEDSQRKDSVLLSVSHQGDVSMSGTGDINLDYLGDMVLARLLLYTFTSVPMAADDLRGKTWRLCRCPTSYHMASFDAAYLQQLVLLCSNVNFLIPSAYFLLYFSRRKRASPFQHCLSMHFFPGNFLGDQR